MEGGHFREKNTEGTGELNNINAEYISCVS